uniref:Egg protein CP391S-like protein n=1 Tax=Schistosoma mansoni TaxID=6183 RepID=A0A5K4FBB7_SCHMA
MRYTQIFCQSITFYSIIFLLLKFINCNEVCSNPELRKNKIVIFQNPSYKYSHHYYYSQLIRLNQPTPVFSGKFEKVIFSQSVVPAFLIKFYDIDVDTLNVASFGLQMMYKGDLVGQIDNELEIDAETNFEISNYKELLALRQTYHKQDNITSFTFTVTSLIYPNGKIAFYYDDVSKTTNGIQLQSNILGVINCEENGAIKLVAKTNVPEEWIYSGTLVEHEVLGDCPKQKTINACEDAKTPDRTCIWCENSDMCTASNDKDNHDFKVDGCHVEVMSNVNDTSEATIVNQRETTTDITEPDSTNELTKITESTESHLSSSIVDASIEPTLTNHKVTTTGITEPDLTHELTETTQTTKSHSNKTTGTTENREERNSKSTQYIVIPLVVVFFIVCIGCAICLWLYRRKKSNP